jgi:hypothetical protein
MFPGNHTGFPAAAGLLLETVRDSADHVGAGDRFCSQDQRPCSPSNPDGDLKTNAQTGINTSACWHDSIHG